MINLIGTYECKMDAKGRVMLPTALKKQLESALHEGFVIKRAVFQPCLELYPMSEWNVLMEKVNKLNRFNKKHNDFIRSFTAGVKIVEPDTTGRVLIPKDLIAFSGVKKQIVMSSSVNIIEIWDKDKYEQAIEASTADFAKLAEEVMGGVSDDEINLS
jgi:MraZ protein